MKKLLKLSLLCMAISAMAFVGSCTEDTPPIEVDKPEPPEPPTPPEPVLYSITFEQAENGAAEVTLVGSDAPEAPETGTPLKVKAGKTITIEATPDAGYELSEWVVVSENATLRSTTEPETIFVMPKEDVVIRPVFTPLPEPPTIYKINIVQTEGGTLKVSAGPPDNYITEATAGTSLRIWAKADEGYEWVAWDNSDNLQLHNEHLYDPATCEMPDGDITVKAEFARKVGRIEMFTMGTGYGSAEVRVDGAKANSAMPGQRVDLVVTDIEQGSYFAGWSSGEGYYLINIDAPLANETFFIMPDANVAVVVAFEIERPEGKDLPDEEYFGTWSWNNDGIVSEVIITADAIEFVRHDAGNDDNGYRIGEMKWTAIVNEGPSASTHPYGFKLNGFTESVFGILPWQDDGSVSGVGSLAVEYWYLSTDKTSLMPGNNPTLASGGTGPYYSPGNEPKPVADYILINGVKWATANVAAPQTFAATQEDNGLMYQWGRGTVGWSTNEEGAATPTPSGTWDGGSTQPQAWDVNPCPDGWRLPTEAEFGTLADSGKVTPAWLTSPVAGKQYTDKESGEVLFLPAVGSRSRMDRDYLQMAGMQANYWTDTPVANSTASSIQSQNSSFQNSVLASLNRGTALPLRCVLAE